MARPVWKGTITFGLVSISVELLKAVESHALSFKVLHGTCNTPIENKRWCSQCDEEVAWEDTVKGMPLEDGTFFVLTQQGLKELRPEKTDEIALVEFVDASEVAPLYYDQHYYVVPQKESDKAYFLLCAALAKYKLAAVGQFVMRTKDTVCLMQPYQDGMLLSTLNYAYEIIPLKKSLKMPKGITSKELELAHMLIKKLYSKTFDIKDFKDTFAQRLKRALKKKKAGKPLPKKRKVVPQESLMASLEASLEAEGKRK